MDLGLEGKVALVTGGTRGLGKAICAALAQEGAHVAVNSRRTDPAPFAAELSAQYRVRTLATPGDISETANVCRIFDQIEHALGPLDVLVNNAGVWPQAFVRDMTDEEWAQTLALNLTAPFLTCREAARRWLGPTSRTSGAAPARAIVNITSQAAYHGATTGHAHYAAAKAGLANFTISLARELAPHGIRVNAVAPGFMETDMAAGALARGREAYLKRIPLNRIADPREVASAVVFLASPQASYITGATLDVNGGMLMR